jgi:CheY-like chemotaxis protein
VSPAPSRRVPLDLEPDATVLYVDDDPAQRELAAALFGGRATVVATPDAAVAALRARPFDVVLSDLDLGDPHRDGVWVLTEAALLCPGAARWLTTGRPGDRAREALDCGLAAKVVPKPWRRRRGQ